MYKELIIAMINEIEDDKIIYSIYYLLQKIIGKG